MRRWRTLRSFADLEAQIEAQCKEAKIERISFDVFDTLVRRRCAPDTVVRGVALALQQVLPSASAVGLDQILAERHRAYMLLATANEACGLDMETSLGQLAKAWVARLCPEEASEQKDYLVSVITDAELRYERWACMPNREMLALCQHLHASGQRLVYTSDMYLGGDVVQALLEECGFGGLFSAGYVSGDHLLLKRTGRLFDHVAEQEGVDPSAIVHVGDDRYSDGNMAVARKFRSFVIEDRQEVRRRNRVQYDHHRLDEDDQWAGVIAAEYAAAEARPDEDPAISIGRDLLGPQLVSFIHYVADYCRDHKVERVFFLSREGYVLRSMYDEVTKALELPVPKGSYLCVSRISSSLGAMGESFSLREINAAVAANARVTPRRIVAPLRFTPDELRHLASDSGLEGLDEPVRLHDSPAFARFVTHPAVTRRARDVGNRGRQTLHDYLSKQGFFDAARVALIDVGWGAQIQENLELAIQGRTDAPEIHGLYLGANRFTEERRRGGMLASAALTDVIDYEWCGGAAFDFVQAYEVATRAPHGTVLGYRDGRPVLAESGSPERGCEEEDDARIARLQLGLVECARQYGRCFRMLGAGAIHGRRYGRNLACRMVRFPRRAESAFFISFNNVSNFGVPETLPLGIKQAWWRPIAFLRAVNGSLWSEGVARVGWGYFGAVALSILKAKRISRVLPRQRPVDAGVGNRALDPCACPAATMHDFEPGLDRHWQRLAGQRSISGALAMNKPPIPGCVLSFSELLVMWLTHRLARLYLTLRRVQPLEADLVPLSAWLQRTLYSRYARQIRGGRRAWRKAVGRWRRARADVSESDC